MASQRLSNTQYNVSAEMIERTNVFQAIIDYHFNDIKLLREALQAAGTFMISGITFIEEGNEPLAVVGNAVRRLVLAENWYSGGERADRLQQIVFDIGSRANLDRVGRLNCFGFYIANVPAHGRFLSPVIMVATVEAVIGAVYLDSALNVEAVKHVMEILGLVPAKRIGMSLNTS